MHNKNNQRGKANQRPQAVRRNQPSKRKKGIDPRDLVQIAAPREQVTYVPQSSYSEMDLSQEMKGQIEKKGYQNPTEIQELAIPVIMTGKDVLGIAATGTGKTAAFLIPIVERMIANRGHLAMVILPTRELALQVEDEFKGLTKGMNLTVVSCIGGTNVNTDMARLRSTNNLIVGTPGRLKDLFSRGMLKLDRIETLVLDEFDRMLDMGFIADMRFLVSRMRSRKQTLLFSATLEPSPKEIIGEFVNDPERIQVSSGQHSNESVDQEIIKVPADGDKFQMLLDNLLANNVTKGILFMETKRQADRMGKRLSKEGVSNGVIHGDRSQSQRVKAIDLFRSGKVKLLVATDVAARGLDINDVTHVINYQVPLTMDSYIHRIGRTGRAGKTGKALTFVD